MTAEELLERYAAGERDFSGLLNSTDLSGANLCEANLSGSKDIIINKTILVRANLQDSFIEGILDSDLRGANLDRINMLELSRSNKSLNCFYRTYDRAIAIPLPFDRL